MVAPLFARPQDKSQVPSPTFQVKTRNSDFEVEGLRFRLLPYRT
jgi:hypothetical protein